ncbi:Flavodoxin [Methanosarcina siciliae T4/M]|uniref:Flavodoxin n=2 Tax=Methanosarcina siciliae TaxID=38027 RepID=A0A0E3PAC0_9EURY|nr:flavodoxin [Methanosarcina siciliae]AKB27059.1 Flavodoxin [Methanosarcina siciliae T4/M]AKB31025.1 Flavodoxin [Methanosarcina siciliae HI350]
MTNLNEEKCLIAYYSRAGNNYVSGKIVNLPVGNTKVVADMVREITGGEVFRIDTVKSYPKDYTATTNVAKKELNDNARPELSSHVENIDSYHVIFLGYPNWWGTMPMPVFTFLEEYDFSEKIIVPFCTHGGGGMGRSENDIAKLCPEATLLKGFAIQGSRVSAAKKDVTDWLNKLGIIS